MSSIGEGIMLTETFDNPYTLITDTAETDFLNDILRKSGSSRSIVYQSVEDPSQFFAVLYFNGAWEVHHVVHNGREFSSGSLLGSTDTKLRYLSTCIKLYRDRLTKIDPVRIVCEPEYWKLYSRIIYRMIDTDRYVANPVQADYLGADGVGGRVAQTIYLRPKMYEAMYSAFDTPIKESLSTYLKSDDNNSIL